MSRRDTIIVAVLLNAAVLAVLFMLAVNTDEDKVSDQSEFAHEIVKPEEQPQSEPFQPIAIAKEQPQDEVDSVLNEYGSSNSAEPIIPDEDSPFTTEKPLETPSNLSVEPAEPSKTTAQNDKIVEVTVKKGDVLERIARANGTTVEAIKSLNNLKTERLKIGQVLRVPIGTAKKANDAKKVASNPATKTSNITSASGEPQYYTIKSGDNPWKIAKQFHVKMDDLLKLNNLDQEKARNLKVGDQIRVR